MNVIPFVHEGLGNSSYLLDLGDGRAALIDPDRSAGRYLRAAEERGLRIVAAFETHLHADFVSGAREVAHATEAQLYVPAGAEARFAHRAVRPGERVRLDGVEVEVIASAGHTPEHLSYVVRNIAGPPMLFSGGALIVGGAARTDLIAPEMTEPLTRAQFRTLHQAFAALPDETALFPTHGGGSFCSTGAGGERTSTLGQERAHNPLLAIAGEEEFVRWFPTTFPAVPAYFFRMRAINQAGPRLRAEIPPPPALPPADFGGRRSALGGLVVDARPAAAYMAGHVPGSLSIPFRDAYATWLGWLAQAGTPLLFVTDGVPLERVVEESLLVGYERFAGWLDGGMTAWERAGLPVTRAELVEPHEARRVLAEGAAGLDVREPDEFAAGHIEGALHVPLGQLPARLAELPNDRPIVTYCAAGDRAGTAISVLERAGFAPLLSLKGGYDAWKAAR